MLENDTGRARLKEFAAAAIVGMLVDVLMSPFTGGPGGQGTGGALGDWLFTRKERKAARLILRARDRTDADLS